MKDDLYYIKKKYGENMAHLCRKLFPKILEENGKLFGILKEHFDYNKNLYNDLVNSDAIIDFYNYIMLFYGKEIEEKKEPVTKTPFELMDEAGYNLYKCESYEDTLKFKKYYQEYEELCTFRDKNRINNYDIFFAVKKDVDVIKRIEFSNPKRQDLYGTSVISIQFSKNSNHLSIKNRYNHTVENPDATFSNNLNNIIDGLSESFINYYGYNIESQDKNFELKDYVNINGKFYHFNIENNNIYYCGNNIIIDNGRITKYDPARFLVFDVFILDIKNKTITTYPTSLGQESFLNTIPKIKTIEIVNNKPNKKIIINKEIEITLNSNNAIIGYKNNTITNIEEKFLFYNEALENLELNNVKTINNDFLASNNSIKKLYLKNLEVINNNFLRWNRTIDEIDLPKVESIGSDFLRNAYNLKKISLPQLKCVGHDFLYNGNSLKYVNLPNIEYVDNNFIRQNRQIKEVYMPKLKYAGYDFLLGNDDIERLVLPNIEDVGSNFLVCNKKLKLCIMPKLKYTGDCFLMSVKEMKSLYLPKLESVGRHFMGNSDIKSVIVPNLTYIEENFLKNDKKIKFVYLPNITYIDNKDFLNSAKKKVKKRIMNKIANNNDVIYTENSIEIHKKTAL